MPPLRYREEVSFVTPRRPKVADVLFLRGGDGGKLGAFVFYDENAAVGEESDGIRMELFGQEVETEGTRAIGCIAEEFLHIGFHHAAGGRGRGADADVAGLHRDAGVERNRVLVDGDTREVERMGRLGAVEILGAEVRTHERRPGFKQFVI